MLTRWEYEYLRGMKIDKRCLEVGQYLLDNPKLGVRGLSRELEISKSQIHRDLHRLKHIDDDMYVQCMHILRRHASR